MEISSSERSDYAGTVSFLTLWFGTDGIRKPVFAVIILMIYMKPDPIFDPVLGLLILSSHFQLLLLHSKSMQLVKRGITFMVRPVSLIIQSGFVWLQFKQIHQCLWCDISGKAASQQVFAVVLNCTYYHGNHRNRQSSQDGNLRTTYFSHNYQSLTKQTLFVSLVPSK